jgi:hypothetical protein
MSAFGIAIGIGIGITIAIAIAIKTSPEFENVSQAEAI